MSAVARAIPWDAPLRGGSPDSTQVAGVVPVHWQAMRARLGPNALSVWAWLCGHRDRFGVTHCTVSDVQRILGGNPSRRSVETIFARLRAFGLVSVAKNAPLTPPGTPYASARWKISRVVYGEWCPGASEVCMVPRAVAKKLKSIPGHGGARPGNPNGKRGGARPGTGKRGGGGPLDPKFLAADEAMSGSSGDVGRTHSSRGATPGTKGESDLVQEEIPYMVGGVPGVALLSSPSVPIVSHLAPDGTLSDGPADTRTADDYPGIVRRPREPGMSTAFASISGVSPAVVPHPPVLPEGISDEDAVRLLELAYVGAVQKVTGKPCWTFKKTNGKWNKVLLAAAKFMSSVWLAPAAWVAFRVDQWHGMTSSAGGKLSPPVGWVFSVESLRKHWAWCDSAGFTALGGRLVFGPAVMEYARRATAQEAGFYRMPLAERTPEKVRAMAEEVFPVSERARLIHAAQAETATMQAELRGRAARGEWIW